MKFKNLSLIILMSLFLLGCTENNSLKETHINNQEEIDIISDEETNDSIVDINSIDAISNSDNVINLETRNSNMVKK